MEKIKNIRKKLRHQRSVRRRKLGLSTPTQIICVSFIAVIALGTLLLTLPIASRHGRLDVLNAMFTATSATCVTGLVVRDTWTQFTWFGQAVVLLLIQVGGLGLVTLTSFFALAMRRRMGFRDLRLMGESVSADGYAQAKEVLKTVNPNIDVPHGVVKLKAVAKMIEHLDSLRDFYLANAGFEVERGAFDAAWVSAMDAMRTCLDERDINEAYREAMGAFRAIPLAKPADPIRIGVVGEMFTAIDERSNLGLDHKLVAMGVEVHRMLNFTNRYLRYNEPNLRVGAKDYLTYDMGPTSTLTVAAAKKYAAGGFDGLIHAKSAGCTPEIDCIPVLQKVSEDYSVPVLYLTYDSQTSDTGLDTRLEAFYDMLSMKKEKSK